MRQSDGKKVPYHTGQAAIENAFNNRQLRIQESLEIVFSITIYRQSEKERICSHFAQ